MKILIYTNSDHDKTVFLVEYMRDIFPEKMRDVILVNLSGSAELNEWAGGQADFSYVYFEEEITYGDAFNQVIKGLGIKDDLLLMGSDYLPLADSFDRMKDVLDVRTDALAVGPVSNSFNQAQEIKWEDAEEALEWSINRTEKMVEETLYLYYGVILFGRDVIDEESPFNEEAGDLGNLILEKCIREFINHKRMYICKYSGFWNVKGNGYKECIYADDKLFDKLFGTHYTYVSGNMDIISLMLKDADNNKKINVLEIGCDCGGTLFEFKKHFKKAELYGVDINENSLKIAAEFANVKVKNIEDKDIDFGVEFDYIIFGDVLEHLRDPLGTLLYCKTLLKKDGRLAASIPNLMNISVIKRLLNGDFTYSDVGLLDRTHIHLFTYNEILKMFIKEAGYTLKGMSMNVDVSGEDDPLIEKLLKLGKAEKHMYQAYQYQILVGLD